MKKTNFSCTCIALTLSLAACGQSAPPARPSGSSAPTSASVSQTDTALSGTLEVWSSGEELGRFVEGFNKLYPPM